MRKGACALRSSAELQQWNVTAHCCVAGCAQDDKACYNANRRQAGYLVYGNDLDSDE